MAAEASIEMHEHSRPIESLHLHPKASLVPMPSGDDLNSLRQSLAENGQQDPVDVTTDGVILEGQQRRAAEGELLHDSGAPVGDIDPSREVYGQADGLVKLSGRLSANTPLADQFYIYRRRLGGGSSLRTAARATGSERRHEDEDKDKEPVGQDRTRM